MMYLDNAATTSPKPKKVIEAVKYALENLSANPGRSSHSLSVKVADEVFSCRSAIADLFNYDYPERVIFTSNCTQSLNYVIKTSWKKDGNIVTSSLEHNAVMRPLEKLKNSGCEIRTAEVFFEDDDATVRSFEKLIDSNTTLVICTHASNVFGNILPIEKICELCKNKNVPFAVDASQTAGIIPINLSEIKIDYLCFPGHKGLLGPMGTGVLICCSDINDTIIEGGTGNFSASLLQPDELPEQLESGTLNVPGIIGLKAGVEFIKSKGINNIYTHEQNLMKSYYKELASIKGVNLYTGFPNDNSAAVLSFNLNNMPSNKASEYLNKFGICVRSGLHCAPSAHKRMGTIEYGTVRISPGIFNNINEIPVFAKHIKNIIKL